MAQTERIGQRFYSLSGAIERDRRAYYDVLERTQRGDLGSDGLDITEWLGWFVGCYRRAVEAAEVVALRVMDKARFWRIHPADGFSSRQRKVLEKLLDGFEGAMTARKWAHICRCSQDTAQRDIAGLLDKGLLIRNPGGGRSTSYAFLWPPEDGGPPLTGPSAK